MLHVYQVQRQMVRCAVNPGEKMRIRAIACVEPSQLVDGGESGGDNAPRSDKRKCFLHVFTRKDILLQDPLLAISSQSFEY